MTSTRTPSRRPKKDIEGALHWLRGALDCKHWHWDPDQRDCAEAEYAAAVKALKMLRRKP